MRHPLRLFVVVLALTGMVAAALPAAAEHDTRTDTSGLRPMGHIVEPASFPGDVHTDLAFWGKHAFQGNWNGFNIRDISAPGNPKHVSFTECTGGQGDVIVWENILVRSLDGSAVPTSGAPAGATCAGEDVIQHFAGLHIFDISDLTAPQLVGSVELSARVPDPEDPDDPDPDAESCGSHTATGVPDLANDRLVIFNGPSTGACPWIDVVEVPLDAPEDAAFVRQVQTGRPCHDNSAILGDAMLLACAGGNGFTVLDLNPDALDDPEFRYSIDVNDVIADEGVVSIGHSTSFTWDGEVLIFGHEPGGGVQARCQETTPDSEKSAFFFDAQEGDFLGMWTLPRPQGPDENCTFHNFNVVPLRSGNYVMAQGSYQSGTSLVDFTDPANAFEFAWSDPPTLGPGPFCSQDAPPGCQLGGAWSSYWYNGLIYETDITEGLNIFRYGGREVAGAIRLGHLNPQTQEFTLP
jgi:hypothetical protein